MEGYNIWTIVFGAEVKPVSPQAIDAAIQD